MPLLQGQAIAMLRASGCSVHGACQCRTKVRREGRAGRGTEPAWKWGNGRGEAAAMPQAAAMAQVEPQELPACLPCSYLLPTALVQDSMRGFPPPRHTLNGEKLLILELSKYSKMEKSSSLKFDGCILLSTNLKVNTREHFSCTEPACFEKFTLNKFLWLIKSKPTGFVLAFLMESKRLQGLSFKQHEDTWIMLQHCTINRPPFRKTARCYKDQSKHKSPADQPIRNVSHMLVFD